MSEPQAAFVAHIMRGEGLEHLMTTEKLKVRQGKEERGNKWTVWGHGWTYLKF